MASETTIHVAFEWVRQDPDGSNCECCKDQCFLYMWVATAVVNGDMQPTDFALCGSCYHAAIENDIL